MTDYPSHTDYESALRRHHCAQEQRENHRGSAARLTELRAVKALQGLSALDTLDWERLEKQSAARSSLGARLLKHFANKKGK